MGLNWEKENVPRIEKPPNSNGCNLLDWDVLF